MTLSSCGVQTIQNFLLIGEIKKKEQMQRQDVETFGNQILEASSLLLLVGQSL